MKDKKRVYLMAGAAVLALGVIYFLASYAVPRMLVTLTKATAAGKVSINNTRVIGEVILAKADGSDKCVVDVYVMDSTDKGVVGRKVVLVGVDSITPAFGLTNSSGKASFSMTSTTEKQYEIAASVDGVRLPKTVKVTFRN
jgi:hypothetical protein